MLFDRLDRSSYAVVGTNAFAWPRSLGAQILVCDSASDGHRQPISPRGTDAQFLLVQSLT